jgi:hypothetical protein
MAVEETSISIKEQEVLELVRNLKRLAFGRGIHYSVANLIPLAVDVGLTVLAQTDEFAIFDAATIPPTGHASDHVLFVLEDSSGANIQILFENDFNESHRSVLGRIQNIDSEPSTRSVDTHREIGGTGANGRGSSQDGAEVDIQAGIDGTGHGVAPSEHIGAGRQHGGDGEGQGHDRCADGDSRKGCAGSDRAEVGSFTADDKVGDYGLTSDAVRGRMSGVVATQSAHAGSSAGSEWGGDRDPGDERTSEAVDGAGGAIDCHEEQSAGGDHHASAGDANGCADRQRLDPNSASGSNGVGRVAETQPDLPVPPSSSEGGGIHSDSEPSQTVRAGRGDLYIGSKSAGEAALTPSGFEFLFLTAERAGIEAEMAAANKQLGLLRSEIANAVVVYEGWMKAISGAREEAHLIAAQTHALKEDAAALTSKLDHVRQVLNAVR